MLPSPLSLTLTLLPLFSFRLICSGSLQSGACLVPYSSFGNGSGLVWFSSGYKRSIVHHHRRPHLFVLVECIWLRSLRSVGLIEFAFELQPIELDESELDRRFAISMYTCIDIYRLTYTHRGTHRQLEIFMSSGRLRRYSIPFSSLWLYGILCERIVRSCLLLINCIKSGKLPNCFWAHFGSVIYSRGRWAWASVDLLVGHQQEKEREKGRQLIAL